MKKLLLIVITLLSSWSFADNEFVRSEAKTLLGLNGAVKSVKKHMPMDDDRYLELNIDFDRQGTGVRAFINQVGFTPVSRQIYKVSTPYVNNKRTMFSYIGESGETITSASGDFNQDNLASTVHQEWFDNYSHTSEESDEVGVMEFFNSENQLVRLKNQYGENFYHYFSFEEWQTQDMNNYSDADRLVVTATEQEIESIDTSKIPSNTEIKVKLSVDLYGNPIQEHIYTQYGHTVDTYQYEYYDVQ